MSIRDDDGGSVRIALRLRPLRLAFFVRFDDRRGLERAIEVSTCLWGGRLNAIIPIYARAPRWARSETFPLSSKSIISGYLEAFEPDYVVSDSEFAQLSNGHEVIAWNDILPRRGQAYVQYGLSVLDLYRHLYREEFKFVSRNSPKMVLPRPSEPIFDLVNSVMFGRFPTGREVVYFESNYRDAFEPKEKNVNGSNVFDLMDSHVGTPLGVGNMEIRPNRPLGLSRPALFYLDPTNVADLIDLWNLRAIGWSPIPIAKQWQSAVVNRCKTLVVRQEEKKKRSQLHVLSVVALCSRNAKRKEFDDFVKAVSTADHPLTVRKDYPRIWNTFGRRADGAQRVDVRVDVRMSEDEQQCGLDSKRISFESIRPDFVEPELIAGTPRWANVVTIRERRVDSNIASVFPRQLVEVDRLLDTMEKSGTTSVTTEGLVLKTGNWRTSNHWTLPSGTALFKFWLNKQGFECNLSSSGLLASQLARMLGGPFFSKIYADVGVIQLMERSSRGKAIGRPQWLEVLSRANNGNQKKAIEHLDVLVEAGILRVGIAVQCPECTRSTWLGLQDIRETVECTHCLSSVRFPSADPDSAKWQYRTVGPFSVENYAQGSLTVLLVVRFLSLPYGGPTWTPSMTMRGAKGRELEFDVALLMNRNEFENTGEQVVLFGECKCFNNFKKADITRARELSNHFPGAVIVFATMRAELNDTEKKLISKFAMGGRVRWRTPVLVLTAHELMGNHLGVPDCWRDKGGKFEPFANSPWTAHRNLVWLCNATQQLHLGLPHGAGIPWD